MSDVPAEHPDQSNQSEFSQGFEAAGFEAAGFEVADQVLIRQLATRLAGDEPGMAALNTLASRLADSRHESRELRLSAQTDQLTGLLSDKGLQAGIARLGSLLQKPPDQWLWRPRDGQPRAPVTGAEIVVFDMNEFKILNDTYGHAEGNKAIQTFAAIIRGSFRETDLIARPSKAGDEFIVVAPVAEDEAGIAEDTITEKLKASIEDMKAYAREHGMDDPRWLDMIDGAYGVAHVTFEQNMDVAGAIARALDVADERMRLNKGDKAR